MGNNQSSSSRCSCRETRSISRTVNCRNCHREGCLYCGNRGVIANYYHVETCVLCKKNNAS